MTKPNIQSSNRLFGSLLTISALMITVSNASASIDLSATIGMGYDDNIYRAPDQSYFDFSIATPQTISPIKHHGFYLPFDVNFDGSKLTSPDVYFVGGYQLKGYRYLSNDFQNANRTDNKFHIGVLREFDKQGVKVINLQGNILFGHINRLYLDRDTGENHTFSSTNTTDVSSRYIYDYTGFEIAYKDRISELQKKASLHLEKRDYQDVPGVGEMQYDNTYTRLLFGIDKKLAKHVKMGVDYSYYTYDFSDRRPRDATGALVSKTPAPFPTRKYTYHNLEFSLRYRQSKDWLHTAKAQVKVRKDHYVGYDNYTKVLLGIKSQWDLNPVTRMHAAVSIWKRDYPNALAFDSVASGEKKKYDGSTIELEYRRRLNDQLDLLGNITHIDENSTDTRYQYFKTLYLVSVEYQLEK